MARISVTLPAGGGGGGTAATTSFSPAGTIAATNVQTALEEVAAEAGGGAGLLFVYRDETGGTYPLRSTVTADATRRVFWIGTVAPAIGGGYMQAQDIATGKPGDVWEDV
jgi:hypothetical protein